MSRLLTLLRRRAAGASGAPPLPLPGISFRASVLAPGLPAVGQLVATWDDPDTGLSLTASGAERPTVAAGGVVGQPVFDVLADYPVERRGG